MTNEQLLSELQKLKKENESIKIKYQNDLEIIRQSEKKLNEKESQSKCLFENAADAIFIADIETGIILDANKAAVDLIKTPLEKIIGLHQTSLHPANLENINKNSFLKHRDELKQSKHSNPIDSVVICPGGSSVPVEVLASIVTYKEKDCMMGTFRDITKRKKIEEALNQERIMLRTIIDVIPDSIYVKDINSRKLIANKTNFQVHLNYKSEDEVIGKTDFDLFPPDTAKQFFDDDQKVLKYGESIVNREEKLTMPNGKTIWQLTTKLPLYDKNGIITGLVGVGRNITERKKAEAEIQLKNKELEEINATKDKLFSIIAHDLRSPFNAFLGLTQMLYENISDFSDLELQMFIKKINESASRLFTLLENLLQWSLMQRGVMEFNPVNVMIYEIVKENIDILSETALQKNIEIINIVPGNVFVIADLQMLNTVIRNLLSNAIKFTPRDGKIEIGIICEKEINSAQISIYIKDNGIGMSKDILDNLFLPDKTVSRSGTEDEPSTGLGLVLCKEFIEKHNGKIWVESRQNKGSTFFVELQSKIVS